MRISWKQAARTRALGITLLAGIALTLSCTPHLRDCALQAKVAALCMPSSLGLLNVLQWTRARIRDREETGPQLPRGTKIFNYDPRTEELTEVATLAIPSNSALLLPNGALLATTEHGLQLVPPAGHGEIKQLNLPSTGAALLPEALLGWLKNTDGQIIHMTAWVQTGEKDGKYVYQRGLYQVDLAATGMPSLRKEKDLPSEHTIQSYLSFVHVPLCRTEGSECLRISRNSEGKLVLSKSTQDGGYERIPYSDSQQLVDAHWSTDQKSLILLLDPTQLSGSESRPSG